MILIDTFNDVHLYLNKIDFVYYTKKKTILETFIIKIFQYEIINMK